MDVAVIIPAYNEAGRIGSVVQAVKNYSSDVIVVDDGSHDATSGEARKAGAIVLTHIINLGKGGAMKTGAEYAISHGADAILYMDGDGQHDPDELPRFFEKLGSYDLVLGARRKKLPFPRSLGKSIVAKAFKMLFDIKTTDPLNGYRAFTATMYPRLLWKSNDYAVECEMLANAGKAHLTSIEVPVKTIYHDKYKGVTPMHGFGILWNLLMWRFQRKR